MGKACPTPYKSYLFSVFLFVGHVVQVGIFPFLIFLCLRLLALANGISQNGFATGVPQQAQSKEWKC